MTLVIVLSAIIGFVVGAAIGFAFAATDRFDPHP
jgi:hypothetical protein